jgi:hypothetical protein
MGGADGVRHADGARPAADIGQRRIAAYDRGCYTRHPGLRSCPTKAVHIDTPAALPAVGTTGFFEPRVVCIKISEPSLDLKMWFRFCDPLSTVLIVPPPSANAGYVAGERPVLHDCCYLRSEQLFRVFQRSGRDT